MTQKVLQYQYFISEQRNVFKTFLLPAYLVFAGAHCGSLYLDSHFSNAYAKRDKLFGFPHGPSGPSTKNAGYEMDCMIKYSVTTDSDVTVSFVKAGINRPSLMNTLSPAQAHTKGVYAYAVRTLTCCTSLSASLSQGSEICHKYVTWQ